MASTRVATRGSQDPIVDQPIADQRVGHPATGSSDELPADRRPRLRISQPGGLGDLLLTTPALRALRSQRPDLHLTVWSRFPDMLRALPWVDVALFSDRHEPDSLYPDYMPCRKDQHLARIVGRCLGVDVEDVRPEVAVGAQLRAEYAARLADFAKPRLFVQRRIGGFTDNKNWPEPHWDRLLSALEDHVTLVECRQPDGRGPPDRLDAPECLSDVARLCALIDACDLFLGPVSGPLHVAAARRKPAVVIVGGFEESLLTAYPGQTQLASTPPCAPCWLLEPCPIDKRCLQHITPEQVLEAVLARLDRLPLDRVPADAD